MNWESNELRELGKFHSQMQTLVKTIDPAFEGVQAFIDLLNKDNYKGFRDQQDSLRQNQG